MIYQNLMELKEKLWTYPWQKSLGGNTKLVLKMLY